MPVKDQKKDVVVGGTKADEKKGANKGANKPAAPENVKADAQTATSTQAAGENNAQPQVQQKVLTPKAWQKVVTGENGKQSLVNVITFMGDEIDYEPGHKEEYFWPNLSAADGLKRVVTAKFPKSEKADQVEEIEVFGYNLVIEKFGNSAVCQLSKDGEVILKYVSLATVLDVLQDELNPKDEDGQGTCNVPWGTIDQVIKHKRGLKSRIKTLGEDDLPARSARRKPAEDAGQSTDNNGAAE